MKRELQTEEEQNKKQGYVRPKDGYILFRRKKEYGKMYAYWCVDDEDFANEVSKKKASDKRCYERNKEKRSSQAKEYYQNNKDKIIQYTKERREGPDREKVLIQKREHYQKNKDYYQKKSREWHHNNKEYVSAKNKEYRKKNKKQLQQADKEYAEKNKERIRDYKYYWEIEQRENNPMFVIKQRCRCRIRNFLRMHGHHKKAKTTQMIGCSWEELMTHLESQFLDGMTWDNRSEWHIDHRLPLAAATTEEEVMKLCHYTNLQPMWGEDNLIKNDKYCPKELAAYLDWPLTLSPNSCNLNENLNH